MISISLDDLNLQFKEETIYVSALELNNMISTNHRNLLKGLNENPLFRLYWICFPYLHCRVIGFVVSSLH